MKTKLHSLFSGLALLAGAHRLTTVLLTLTKLQTKLL